MNRIVLAAAAAAVVVGPAATAQTTSYKTNKPLMKGDPDKMVCVAEESVGSRLGRKKTCLTVEQWNEKARTQREFADEIQSGAWGAQSESAVEMTTPQGGGPQ